MDTSNSSVADGRFVQLLPVVFFDDLLAGFLVQPAYVAVRNDMERALKPIWLLVYYM